MTNVMQKKKPHLQLSTLSTQQVFEVLYQIRNNLFHGSKDPYKSQRNAFLSQLAADVMVPFVGALLTATAGGSEYLRQ